MQLGKKRSPRYEKFLFFSKLNIILVQKKTFGLFLPLKLFLKVTGGKKKNTKNLNIIYMLIIFRYDIELLI